MHATASFTLEHTSIVVRLYVAMTAGMMRNCLAINCHVAVPILAQATIASKLDLSQKARPPTTFIAAAATGADSVPWNWCALHKIAQRHMQTA
jgi:hypothetical protein